MGGTRLGGIKSAKKNKELYGAEFYKRIGHIGGTASTNRTQFKGFASNKELASKVGKIGGMKSRRGKASVKI